MTSGAGNDIHAWSAALGGHWRNYAAGMARATVAREQQLAKLRKDYEAGIREAWTDFHAYAEDLFRDYHAEASDAMGDPPIADPAAVEPAPPGPTGDGAADLAALTRWAAEHNPASQDTACTPPPGEAVTSPDGGTGQPPGEAGTP